MWYLDNMFHGDRSSYLSYFMQWIFHGAWMSYRSCTTFFNDIHKQAWNHWCSSKKCIENTKQDSLTLSESTFSQTIPSYEFLPIKHYFSIWLVFQSFRAIPYRSCTTVFNGSYKQLEITNVVPKNALKILNKIHSHHENQHSLRLYLHMNSSQ